jgi:hypothetical protein
MSMTMIAPDTSVGKRKWLAPRDAHGSCDIAPTDLTNSSMES